MAFNKNVPLPLYPVIMQNKTLTGQTGSAWIDFGAKGNYFAIVKIKINSLGGTAPTQSIGLKMADDTTGTNAIEVLPAPPASGNIGEYVYLVANDTPKQTLGVIVTLGGTSPTINYDVSVFYTTI